MEDAKRPAVEVEEDIGCGRGDGADIKTEVRSPGQLFREELKKRSKLDCDKSMSVYQVPMTEKVVANRIHMFDFWHKPVPPKPEKIILLVGAAGAGKSTLINCLFDNVIGVEWAEKCRFRLVPDSPSFDKSTQSITIYTLHHHSTYNIPYTIRVIDTPGFGGTEGISKDKLVTEGIRNLFSNKDCGIDHIDAIGLVTQSYVSRLTPTQKYIFDSILSLFGKDIGENIFLLITFGAAQKMPPVLTSAREAKIPFKSYFKFNNSALFARNDTNDNEFDQMLWKMGETSFQRFLSQLENVQGRSVCLTKQVLEERQQLEVYVAGIQKDVHNGLSKLEQFKVEICVVRQYEADIERNKNFTYTVEEQKTVHVPMEPGKYVTRCLVCDQTCHYPCQIQDDKDKARCWAMDKDGSCRICPQNCKWNLHRAVPYRIEVETVLVTKTVDELKRRYEGAKAEKMNAEKQTEQILKDFCDFEMKVRCMINEIRRGIKRLSEIGLRPSPLSTVGYLDLLIMTEKAEGKPGFHARIEQLATVKAQAQALSEMAADEGYDPFKEYRETLKMAKTLPITDYH